MLENLNKIAFVGAGNMAQAIINGLIQKGLSPERIFASARSEETRNAVASKYGVQTGSNIEASNPGGFFYTIN